MEHDIARVGAVDIEGRLDLNSLHAASTDVADPAGGRIYSTYVLVVITAVFTLNFTDRALLNLLVQPIKTDLTLSDTQIGFLTGIAFALFYATLGIPMARFADRGNRVSLTALAIGLWSLTVMSCLVVSNFIQLVAARALAAVGEAGCMPPTYSLLGDYFPSPQRRARAMAVYWLANPLSALISFVIGGWLSNRYGWRIAFFIMGLPGLLAAIVVRLTVKEVRTASEKKEPISAGASLFTVAKQLYRDQALRHLALGIVFYFMMTLGLAPWYAAFMLRSHGLGIQELGLWFGLIFGVSGVVGALMAAWLAGRSRLVRGGTTLLLCAVVTVLLVPCYVVFLFSSSAHIALAALVPMAILFNSILGPLFAEFQTRVAPSNRATALALLMLAANLIGAGLGPQIVGGLSDLLAPTLGTDALRYAMMADACMAFVAAYHFWRTGLVHQTHAQTRGGSYE